MNSTKVSQTKQAEFAIRICQKADSTLFPHNDLFELNDLFPGGLTIQWGQDRRFYNDAQQKFTCLRIDPQGASIEQLKALYAQICGWSMLRACAKSGVFFIPVSEIEFLGAE